VPWNTACWWPAQGVAFVKVPGTPVVSRQGHGHTAAVAVQEVPQVLSAALDIFPGVISAPHPQIPGGTGHELHQAHGSDGGGSPGVEVALHFNHCLDQSLRHVVAFGRLL
jgi:hypothetical protein